MDYLLFQVHAQQFGLMVHLTQIKFGDHLGTAVDQRNNGRRSTGG